MAPRRHCEDLESSTCGGSARAYLLGAIVLLFYRSEEFGSLIGIASVIIGLGFLWRSLNE
jgi:hypothetical protein